MEKIILGIDIGGTNTKYGFITKKGEVLSSHIIPTNTKIPFEDYALGLKKDVLDHFYPHKSNYEIEAIGVGAPNGNGKTGFIEYPPNLAWDLVDLKGIFSEVFGVTVEIENDANVAAVGEKIFGQAKAYDNFVVLTLGTGLGVGTYINGELYLGSHGLGSEAGHLTIIPEGRDCSCGGKGHLEAYASCTGMKKSVNEVLGTNYSFREVSKLFNAGNADVSKVLDESARHLAIGMGSINSLLAPQSFILCGGGTSLGQNFRDLVEKHYKNYVYSPFKNYSKIELSSVSTEYGAILGASSLVL
ncbi:MAG: hypothetical protein CME62_04335 [Halobacteriovoraceae bacterium]|nr:hypothetical protein [Halobacteriovoraceae bacterium]|tara:strand:- start:9549 stop:10451 length:903 start_codon:yes stop_codon:yes gene_type:complete